MPYRSVAAKELSDLLGVLAHPERLFLVEELRGGERDVNTLRSLLGVSQAKVSRHLGLLRAHHIVSERREGRHVFYRLTQSGLANWLAEGLIFIERSPYAPDEVREAAERARETWLHDT
ncbi:MAG: ArsR/SmtB family transcription factor [Candidatus Sericytochromatia bacterium]